MPDPPLLTHPQIRKWLIVIGGTLLVMGAGLMALRSRLLPLARERVIRMLAERYQSVVELKDFNVTLFPHIQVTGQGLVVRHKGRTDGPPLVTIQQFSADISLRGWLSTPKQVRSVRLNGLWIQVPPRREEGERDRPEKNEEITRKYPFVMAEIIADGTRLDILPQRAGSPPLTFEIYQLTLHSVGIDRPLSFRATLTNPKPPGLIQSTGEFGPWQAEEPSQTPVSGRYTFQNADLSVFHGIAGLLSSEGAYKGVLERIEVDGKTNTPDFTVRISGHPVHLVTQFHAVVDGTNGDTRLQPVQAQFRHSAVLARGGVIGRPGVKGKTVVLDVAVAEARLEDLLRLAVKSDRPPMTGAVRLTTKFELPPGEADVVDRLYLKGEFQIASARFTSLRVQEKVETLSRRGQGETDEGDAENVVSNFQGRFVLKNGRMTFSDLSFDVPGASIHLNGQYGLRDETLDFRGTLRLKAKLSQTTTGVKSFFLRILDPFFHKKGVGTVLPIKITGTRQEPSFGLDMGHALVPGR